MKYHSALNIVDGAPTTCAIVGLAMGAEDVTLLAIVEGGHVTELVLVGFIVMVSGLMLCGEA